jgi:hypothetical protein
VTSSFPAVGALAVSISPRNRSPTLLGVGREQIGVPSSITNDVSSVSGSCTRSSGQRLEARRHRVHRRSRGASKNGGAIVGYVVGTPVLLPMHRSCPVTEPKAARQRSIKHAGCIDGAA